MKITKEAKFLESENAFEVEIRVYLEKKKSGDIRDLYRSSCSLISSDYLNDSGINYMYNHLSETLNKNWGNVSSAFPIYRTASLVFQAKTPGTAKSILRSIQDEVLRSIYYISETNRSGALDAEDLNRSPEFQDKEYNFIPECGHYGNGDNLQTSLDRE